MTKSEFLKLVANMAFAESEIVIHSDSNSSYSVWLADANRGACEGQVKLKSARSRGKAEELCYTYQRWLAEFEAFEAIEPEQKIARASELMIENGANKEVAEKGFTALIGKQVKITIAGNDEQSGQVVESCVSGFKGRAVLFDEANIEMSNADGAPPNGLWAFMITDNADFCAWLDIRKGDDILVSMNTSVRYGNYGFKQVFRRPDNSEYVLLIHKPFTGDGKSMEKLFLNAIKRKVKELGWFDSKKTAYGFKSTKKAYCRQLMHCLAISVVQEIERDFVKSKIFHDEPGWNYERFIKHQEFLCAFEDIIYPIAHAMATEHVRANYLEIVANEFEAL